MEEIFVKSFTNVRNTTKRRMLISVGPDGARKVNKIMNLSQFERTVFLPDINHLLACRFNHRS